MSCLVIKVVLEMCQNYSLKSRLKSTLIFAVKFLSCLEIKVVFLYWTRNVPEPAFYNYYSSYFIAPCVNFFFPLERRNTMALPSWSLVGLVLSLKSTSILSFGLAPWLFCNSKWKVLLDVNCTLSSYLSGYLNQFYLGLLAASWFFLSPCFPFLLEDLSGDSPHWPTYISQL